MNCYKTQPKWFKYEYSNKHHNILEPHESLQIGTYRLDNLFWVRERELCHCFLPHFGSDASPLFRVYNRGHSEHENGQQSSMRKIKMELKSCSRFNFVLRHIVTMCFAAMVDSGIDNETSSH